MSFPKNITNDKEQSDNDFNAQYLKDSIEEKRYLLRVNKNTRISYYASIVKDTPNNCLSCKRCDTYIYCPIFNEHFADNKYFDETGEKDGCTEYIGIHINTPAADTVNKTEGESHRKL